MVEKYHTLRGRQPRPKDKAPKEREVKKEVRNRRQAGGRLGSSHPIMNVLKRAERGESHRKYEGLKRKAEAMGIRKKRMR